MTEDQHEEQQPEQDADGQRDRDRLCGYSGCRAPLPITSGPGNRPRYCQDGRTWGSRNVNCKQAGHAEELLASIGTSVAPQPIAVAELAERIDVVLDPTRDLVGSLEQLREQLRDDIVAAHRERDEALAGAAEQRGLREIAEQRANESVQYADECRVASEVAAAERDAARAEANAATTAQQTAEHARLRAEARADELNSQLERTDGRLQAATGHAEDLDRRLAGANAEIVELRQHVEEERSRGEAERTRADRLAAEYQQHLDQVRTAAEDRAAEQRRDHEQERAALVERHEAALAQLHEQLGRRNQMVSEAQDRAEQLNQHLQRWRDDVAEVIQIIGPLIEQIPQGTEAAERIDQGDQIERARMEVTSRLQALLDGAHR